MSHLYRHPPKTGNYWLAWHQHGKLFRKPLKDINGNTTKDRAAAKYLQAQRDQELAQGKAILPNQDNVIEPVLRAYRDFKAGQRNAEYNNVVYKRIQDYFTWSNIKTFRQINEESLQKYLNYRADPPKAIPAKERQLRPLCAVSLNHVIRDVKEFIHYAVRREIIAKDPLIHFKPITEEDNLRKIFTKEQMQIFLKEANNPAHYVDGVPTLWPLIFTDMYSGMRKREVFKLEWSNCDFKEGIFRITNRPNFKVKTLKERIIPMNAAVKKMLLELKVKTRSDYCFDTTNWRRILDRILKAAKLKQKGVGINVIRHSFASHYIMDTGDVKGAQEMLGHSDIKTTMGYTHLLLDHLKSKMEKFDPLGKSAGKPKKTPNKQ